MQRSIRAYLAAIGEKGGCKSRRKLSARDAHAMVKVREAKKAYRKYYHQCFWSCKPDLRITIKDVKWVGEQIMKQGGREAWLVGGKLCR